MIQTFTIQAHDIAHNDLIQAHTVDDEHHTGWVQE